MPGWGLLLDAARIGQHQVGMLHQADHRQVIQRRQQGDILQPPAGVHYLLHVRVEVHRVDELPGGIASPPGAAGQADVLQRSAEVLPAVGSDQHHRGRPGGFDIHPAVAASSGGGGRPRLSARR